MLTDPAGRLDLNRLLRIAAERNPEVLAARADAEGETWRFDQVTSLPDPMIRLGWYAESIETRTGAQKAVLGLQQNIPWPGKLAAAGNAAALDADLARLRSWIVTRNVLERVRVSYHELAYLHAAIEASEAMRGAVTRLVAQAAREPSLPDMTRAETWLAQLGHDVLMYRELLIAEEENLRAALSLPRGAPVGRPTPVAPLSLGTSLDALQDFAREHNQELALARVGVLRAEAGIAVAEQKSYPDFSVGGRYIVTDPRRDASPAGNGDDPLLFEIGMTVPLYRAPKRAAVAEARARAHASSHRRAASAQKLRADVARAWWKVVNAERLVKLYAETLVPQSERSARATESLQREGLATVTAVIETLSAWHHYALALLRARADWARDVARLESLAGAPLELTGEER